MCAGNEALDPFKDTTLEMIINQQKSNHETENQISAS